MTAPATRQDGVTSSQPARGTPLWEAKPEAPTEPGAKATEPTRTPRSCLENGPGETPSQAVRSLFGVTRGLLQAQSWAVLLPSVSRLGSRTSGGLRLCPVMEVRAWPHVPALPLLWPQCSALLGSVGPDGGDPGRGILQTPRGSPSQLPRVLRCPEDLRDPTGPGAAEAPG